MQHQFMVIGDYRQRICRYLRNATKMRMIEAMKVIGLFVNFREWRTDAYLALSKAGIVDKHFLHSPRLALIS